MYSVHTLYKSYNYIKYVPTIKRVWLVVTKLHTYNNICILLQYGYCSIYSHNIDTHDTAHVNACTPLNNNNIFRSTKNIIM